MNKTHAALSDMGARILNNTRTELFLSMHFMGAALGSLGYEMDLSTTEFGTDAVSIRFNPNFLRTLFIEHPRRLNRIYIHMIMHCLFRHMFFADLHEDRELWDLCCDIAAESVVDSMDYPAIDDVITDRRAAIYRRLEEEVGVFTAERLYKYFSEKERDYVYEEFLAREFHYDDHSFWKRLEDAPSEDGPKPPDLPESPPPQGPSSDSPEDQKDDPSSGEKRKQEMRSGTLRKMKDEEWKKNAERLRTELTIGRESSDKTGSLVRILTFENTPRPDYRDFLERFTVVREEAMIDPDSFDYGFYNYGLMLYGNLPLIEENEFREARKVDELAIAIDTSASCQDSLVQKFLNETASILLDKDRFFHRVNIHIIECDDQVQNDVVITDVEQMKRYAEGFTLKGGFGTDFRPVFRYIEELRRKKAFTHLKGLMYFTDGYGIYPTHPTDYDTAFVFRKDEDLNDKDVPEWAIRLYI